MKLKKIISGLMTGVIAAAAISMSAFAAAPTVNWSNGETVTATKTASATSTGTLSASIISATTAVTTFEFDLLLKGANTGASYLALKSGEEKVISIERKGWSSMPYTVNDTTVIDYNSKQTDSVYNKHHFVVTLDFGKDTYEVKGTNADTGRTDETLTATGAFTADNIDSLELFASTNANNTASIANLTITTQDITGATAYAGYTINNDYANTDIAGFTAEITSDTALNSATWYLKRTTDAGYKEFTSVDISKVDPQGGTVKIGLIVTGLNAQGVTAEALTAGYTVSGTAAE